MAKIKFFQVTRKMNYKEKIEKILTFPRPNGKKWKKSDIARYLRRDRSLISRITAGEDPANPNVQKGIDDLLSLLEQGVTVGEKMGRFSALGRKFSTKFS